MITNNRLQSLLWLQLQGLEIRSLHATSPCVIAVVCYVASSRAVALAQKVESPGYDRGEGGLSSPPIQRLLYNIYLHTIGFSYSLKTFVVA